ncbi:MAG: YidC/Oxa1 family membrane protein insertase [Eubacteriales bacterium]|nr:YidC/Oxa1 family membrane protein insertase [Eubacteriales bacterium]
MLLTKSETFIIGPIASILGYLMNAIFWVLDKIGIPNTGLSIIIFTFVIYTALMPLTIKQQKFSKLQNKMMPEIKKIQDKYKNKKDNDSMMRQNEEIQTVYKRYGVSATGSCVQLLIQMPILFSLYRVIYNMPAYVTQVKDAFLPLVDKLMTTEGAIEYIQNQSVASQFASQFNNENFTGGVTTYVQNTLVDVLNKFSTADWSNLADNFTSLSAEIGGTLTKIQEYNNFLGLNIGDSPAYMVQTGWQNGAYLMIVAAFIIPVLSAVTQWINVKLMPQANTSQNGKDDNSAMASSMKTMNTMMPLMSAFFCFTLPSGMGLYWIAGSVIRSIQQVVVNKHIDKMDIDAMIQKNEEKYKEKLAKSGGKQSVSQRMMSEYSNMNTKKIVNERATVRELSGDKKDALEKSEEIYSQKKYKQGSLAAKANMVKDFNESRRS